MSNDSTTGTAATGCGESLSASQGSRRGAGNSIRLVRSVAYSRTITRCITVGHSSVTGYFSSLHSAPSYVLEAGLAPVLTDRSEHSGEEIRGEEIRHVDRSASTKCRGRTFNLHECGER